MSSRMTKPTKWSVRPATTQISLGIRPVWPESSLYAQWIAKDLRLLHAGSKDCDQTGRMPRLRLIWVFAGHTSHFVGFVVLRLKMILADFCCSEGSSVHWCLMLASTCISEFGWSVFCFLLFFTYFPSKPPLPPSPTASIQRVEFKSGVKKLARYLRNSQICVNSSIIWAMSWENLS